MWVGGSWTVMLRFLIADNRNVGLHRLFFSVHMGYVDHYTWCVYTGQTRKQTTKLLLKRDGESNRLLLSSLIGDWRLKIDLAPRSVGKRRLEATCLHLG